MLWLMQTVFLQAFYDQSVKAGVRDAAARIERSWVEDGPEGFSAVLDKVAAERSLLVFVATWDSDVLYSTDEHSAAYTAQSSVDDDSPYGRSWASGVSEGGEPFGSAMYGWQVGKARQIGLTQGFSSFLARLSQEPDVPIEYQDDDSGLYTYGVSLAAEGARGSACEEAGAPAVLYLSTTLLPVGAAATAIRTQLVFASVAALVLAFLLALVLAKGFSKPVEQLTRKAGLLSDDSTAESSEGVYEGGFCEELDRLSLAIDGAAADLAAAEGQRAEFMANVSHDLRTPITLIKGYAEAVLDDMEDGVAPDKRDLEVVAREATRLGALAGDLLDYSKLKTGASEPKPAEFDASGAFQAAVSLFGPLCERGGIRLEVDIEPGVRLLGDEGQLARVVSNLVDNAVSHVGEGGKVLVRLSASSGIVRLEVRDDGPGIPPEELERVWERYFTKSQDKRNAKGSGLGLAIAREILCAHGARYGAGNAQGGGAVFWFEMPGSR